MRDATPGDAEADAEAALYDVSAAGGKAPAGGTRLKPLDPLARGERTVDSLARAAGPNLTTVSAHPQTLRRAGFVATRREGVRNHYRLAGDDVARFLTLPHEVADRHRASVPAARSAYLGEDGAVEVTSEELRARAEAGEVVVLDVRPAEEYLAGHIPGAISIPVTRLADRIAELPGRTGVVVSCRGAYRPLAHDAVRLPAGLGRRAARLSDGVLARRPADLPVHTGEAA
ncbi:rhodanese-like domain-containing protein [Streptomyces sp. NPDC018610]|uniref:rhodanese-like domain-containing protein n=1 Tax=Streptomyces sp. NPDC018610 TaxID=3365049 RepID=UPI0037A52B34